MRSTAGAIERRQHAGGPLAVQQQLVVAFLWTILGLAIAFAALLIVRRISGAFQQSLGGMAIVMVAIATELAVFSCRRLSISTGLTASQYSVLSTQYSVLYVLPSILAVAALVSLTIPGTPLLGLLLAWLIVIAGEAVQLHLRFSPIWSSAPPVRPIPTSSPLPSEAEGEPAEAEIPTGLIQQVTRVLEDDHESIHALVQANVPANDRLAIIHLAFCPPLAGKPELRAHALDIDNADVRITQAETFGARLEVRLPAVASSERSFLIEVLGSVTT